MHEQVFVDIPYCTSAFRFMEHYYCFHGHMFSKFDPKHGETYSKYPKEARDYFMRCAKFSKCLNKPQVVVYLNVRFGHNRFFRNSPHLDSSFSRTLDAGAAAASKHCSLSGKSCVNLGASGLVILSPVLSLLCRPPFPLETRR